MLLWKVFHQYLPLLQNFQWPCIIEVGYTCQGLVEMEEMIAENKEFKKLLQIYKDTLESYAT